MEVVVICVEDVARGEVRASPTLFEVSP